MDLTTALVDTFEVVLTLLVLIGAVPLVISAIQFLLIGLHGWRNHYDRVAPCYPRVAVLVPAWNEGAVIGATVDRLLTLDYPADRLRVVVVDDASTDDTPDVVADRARRNPGRVVHLRREEGGQGKAHTLNHGLAELLSDDWMEAVLIMDADVIYRRDSLRKMTRHLADPTVGAVTAYIKEGSQARAAVNRFVGYEYITAQAAARRSQNVQGVMACLAGGAQLHRRDNLEELGGRIDTETLAEDTVTTFQTQRNGRRVVFEGNAVVLAEEPADVAALWRQRLRWARGNIAVTRRFSDVWFRRRREPRMGGILFGLSWFSILLLPLVMIAGSTSLLVLYLLDPSLAWSAFHGLWVINLVTFVFITAFTLMIDPSVGRRTVVEAFLFPGLVSFAIIVATCFPALASWSVDQVSEILSVDRTTLVRIVTLLAYSWLALCMVVAWLAKVVAVRRPGSRLSPALVYVAGYGALLCAVTFAGYVEELRGAEMTWDRTVKTGKVAVS